MNNPRVPYSSRDFRPLQGVSRILALIIMAVSENLTIERLVLNALNSVKKDATPQQTTEYETQKKDFEQLLIKSATITDDTEKEVRKIKVNESEEVHSNPGNENKFVKTVSTSGSFNFQQQTTEGLVWDRGINLAQQFRRPTSDNNFVPVTQYSQEKNTMQTKKSPKMKT